MSIASEITRISGNIADAYIALDAKGATLPAAGSQNSANLADTIDTITTGGGGNISQKYGNPYYSLDDFRESEYLTALHSIESEIGKNYQDTITKSALQTYLDNSSNGWVKTNWGANNLSSNDWIYFYVLSISNTLNKIRISCGSIFHCAYFKIPSTATYTEDTANNRVTITFNGDERWIALGFNSETAFPEVGDCIKNFSVGDGTIYTSASIQIRAVGIVQWTSSTVQKNISSSSDLASLVGTHYPYLTTLIRYDFPDNFNFGISYPTTSSEVANEYRFPLIFKHLLQLIPEEKLYTHFSDFSENSYYSLPSSTVSIFSKTCGSTADSAAFSITDLFNINNYKRCPFVLDFSQYEGTSELKLFRDNSSSFYRAVNLRDIALKLPSTCNVNLKTAVENDSSASIPLSLESYQYMAENAPSCSKTIKVGNAVYAAMNTNSDWATVKATFETKGWTVSET